MEGRTLGKVNLKGDTLWVHRDPRNNGNKTCEDSEAIGKRSDRVVRLLDASVTAVSLAASFHALDGRKAAGTDRVCCSNLTM